MIQRSEEVTTLAKCNKEQHMALDQQFVATVKGPIVTTWQCIAHDVYELCEDNEEAMEMCIDADRLLLNGENPTAHALVRDTIRANGYRETLAFLAAHIQLL